MKQAIGISVHTGWGACVVVGGTLAKPEIVANEVIQFLTGPERFCFHRAEQMARDAAERWSAAVRIKALANARAALTPLVARASYSLNGASAISPSTVSVHAEGACSRHSPSSHVPLCDSGLRLQ